MGKMQGQGTLTTKKFIYKGKFESGEFEPSGHMVFKNKGEYKGAFQKGKFEGYGKFI